MSAAEVREIADVVEEVQAWPASKRISLARRILETLDETAAREPASKPRQCPSAAEVAALFQTDQPAPDDDTVSRWIDEHRMSRQ